MKKRLLILCLLFAGALMSFAQNLDSIPEGERNSILLSIARQVVLKYGPDYYRDYKQPVVTRELMDPRGDYKKQKANRPYYKICFYYDPEMEKDLLSWDYMYEVSVWTDNWHPFMVFFGNGLGIHVLESDRARIAYQTRKEMGKAIATQEPVFEEDQTVEAMAFTPLDKASGERLRRSWISENDKAKKALEKNNVKTPAVSKTKKYKSKDLTDSQWPKTLKKSRKVMRKLWLTGADPLSAYENPQYVKIYNLASSKKELKQLKPVPVEVFEIDSASFRHWKSDRSPQSMMKLKKDETSCFFVKKEKFFYRLNLKYEKSQWIHNGFSGIYKDIADTLSMLYFKKKITPYVVYVKTDSHPDGYRFPYFVYTENGILKSVQNGDTCRLFKDELTDLKRPGW